MPLGGGGMGGRLVPSSHERSESACRHKIIQHPDSLREKATCIPAEGI